VPENNASQLTRARFAQRVRAERHFVPHRAFVTYGPSQLKRCWADTISMEKVRE
jgi:hypothetical protein